MKVRYWLMTGAVVAASATGISMKVAGAFDATTPTQAPPAIPAPPGADGLGHFVAPVRMPVVNPVVKADGTVGYAPAVNADGSPQTVELGPPPSH